MNPGKDDNIWICPHCGTENILAAESWADGVSKDEPILCVNCKGPLHDARNSGNPGTVNTPGRHFNRTFFIIVVLLSGLMVYLNRTFDVLTLREDSGQIVYEMLLILVVSFSLASGKIRRNLRYLAIWAVIFLVLMTGYSYRHELSGIKERVLAEIIPARGVRKSPDSVSFPVSSDGHFHIRAEVNGIPVMFLADTGASHIVLSPADAAKAGIDTDELRFDRFYETANGTVRGSSIRIADFRIGGIHLKEIGASVNEAEMRDSLLGMTFFSRLKSYEVKNDVLTLYWRE